MRTVDELLESFGNKPLEDLTVDQAKQLLQTFIEGEASNFEILEFGDVVLDYSERSVRDLIYWVVEHELREDPEAPNLQLWALRVGYYFGESLRRVTPKLYWTTADPEYALGNQPAITGFSKWPNGFQEEAAVVVICRNLLSLAAEGANHRIDTAMNLWFARAMETKG